MATQQLSDGRPDGTVVCTASEKLGFFAATTVVKQTGAAAGTDAATTQTLANQLRTVFINYGLITTVT